MDKGNGKSWKMYYAYTKLKTNSTFQNVIKKDLLNEKCNTSWLRYAMYALKLRQDVNANTTQMTNGSWNYLEQA